MLTKTAKNQRLQSYSNSRGLNGLLNDFNKSPLYLSHSCQGSNVILSNQHYVASVTYNSIDFSAGVFPSIQRVEKRKKKVCLLMGFFFLKQIKLKRQLHFLFNIS